MKTIIDLFEQSIDQHPDHIFIMENHGKGYEGLSYTEAKKRILSLASWLIGQGIQKGDRVAILSENRQEWILSDLAILYAGGIVVTLSNKLLEPLDLKARLENSTPSLLFVSSKEKEKAEATLALMPQDTKPRLVCFDEDQWDTMLQTEILGEDTPQKRNSATSTDDPALIIYTSGTTGNQKGVTLSHHNYLATVRKHLAHEEQNSDSCTLALLPLDHCLFHAYYYLMMAIGATLAMPQLGNNPLEAMLNMMKNIREVQPDFLAVVPAMLQTFKTLLIQQGISDSPEKAREFFGGKINLFIAGGAYIDPEIEKFFLALNLPIYIGYGMTEATIGVSKNYKKQHRIGSIGHLSSLQQNIRIVDENGNDCPKTESGEIIFQGETVMLGYWNNPTATREALSEGGWFHTGDLAHQDSDGYLYIDGRVKSLLISNSGEKYSPEGIESALLESSPYIHQLMLYNQQSPCTIALVVPNKEQLADTVAVRGLSLETKEGKDAAINLIDEVFAQFRKGGSQENRFPQVWLPSTFALLEESFTTENGLLTATQKLSRQKVANAYKERINSLFNAERMNPRNEDNRNALQ